MKGRAPVNNEVLKITLPRPREADLSNGVHLMVLEDHRVPQVSFQLLIQGAGGYYDPPGLPGLAGFTASLMREGTTTRPSEKISQDLDRLAASVTVNAGLSSPFATVFGSGLTENLDTVLAMTADLLLNPAFPEEEISRYKARTRAQLLLQRSNPGFLAIEQFQRLIYGDHPAARAAATPAALDALTRDALVEFHRAHYLPDHAVLAVAGDITMADAQRRFETALSAWHKGSAPKPATADPAAPAGKSVLLVSRPGSVQTNLIVGTQAIERTNPDYDALIVANKVLGAGPASRLFMHLREQKGYTYGVGSGVSAQLYRGDWQASMAVRTEVTDPALTDLLDEIRQMREVVVPAKELGDARRSLVSSFALSLENPSAVLNNYVTLWIYKLPADYWDTYPQRIEAITAADVRRVAQKYFAPEHLQIVAVGDAAKVTPALKKLGEVKTYDADGKPIMP
jgi:zinc protease